MKKKKMPDHHAQALHALNCAIACMVSWPQSDEKRGAAVYFTTLALHRMAQADPDGRAADSAEACLEQARSSKSGAVHVPSGERP